MYNRPIIIGSIIIGLLIFTALFAPLLSPFDPNAIALNEQLSKPSPQHFLGQDKLGRDVFSRIIFGARVSILVGILVVGISLIIGILIGAISGYFGGLVDELFMRIIDILLAFPGILLAIAMTAVLGPSLRNVIIALSILGWVRYARLTRGQILSLREREYISSAKALGVNTSRIILKHILPNTFAPLIVEATFGMAGAILAEASLSFLGLGTKGMPSWGAMLNEGVEYLFLSPHLSLYPGLAIMLVVLGFNFLGDGLRDQLDPKKSVIRR